VSRTLAWSFGIGVTLILVGGLLAVAATGSGGEILMLAGLLMVGVLPIFSNAMSRRSRGWTRAWNPRAARRDLRAERTAAAQAKGTDGRANGGDQAR
jgi:hypothetical protein